MASTKNLVIDQGATFSANIQYLDNSKNPISLAGYNVRSKIRTSYDSPNAVTLTATVTNASTGNVNLYLDAANTSLVHYGRYVYDVEAYSGNTVIRIQEGAITVTPGVSGNSVGTILRQTLNSLVNGSYTVSLDANGRIQLPNGGTIGPVPNSNGVDIKVSNTYDYVELNYNDDNYMWLAVDGAYIGTNWNTSANTWTFDKNGVLTLPSGAKLISAYPGQGRVQNAAALTGDLVYLSSFNGNSLIGIQGGDPVITARPGDPWIFNYNGSITFPDGNVQTTAFVSSNYVSKAVLKSIVANSATWSAFQANIAAL